MCPGAGTLIMSEASLVLKPPVTAHSRKQKIENGLYLEVQLTRQVDTVIAEIYAMRLLVCQHDRVDPTRSGNSREAHTTRKHSTFPRMQTADLK
jgi:hypothetical protein